METENYFKLEEDVFRQLKVLQTKNIKVEELYAVDAPACKNKMFCFMWDYKYYIVLDNEMYDAMRQSSELVIKRAKNNGCEYIEEFFNIRQEKDEIKLRNMLFGVLIALWNHLLSKNVEK